MPCPGSAGWRCAVRREPPCLWCTGGGQSCPPTPAYALLCPTSFLGFCEPPSLSYVLNACACLSALPGDTALPSSRGGFFFALVDILKWVKDHPTPPPPHHVAFADKTGPPLSGPGAPSCLPEITDIEHCSMLTREETLCPAGMLAQVPATTQQGGGHREILSSRVFAFQIRSTCPAGTGDKMNSEGRMRMRGRLP